MIGNKYVENKKLENYDNIFFNGILSLQFSHNWIEIEIISGFNLLKDKNFFIDITLGDYEQRKKFEEKIQQDKNKMHYVALVGTCHLLDKNKIITPHLGEFHKIFPKINKKLSNIDKVLSEGGKRADMIASKKVSEIKRIIGF